MGDLRLLELDFVVNPSKLKKKKKAKKNFFFKIQDGIEMSLSLEERLRGYFSQGLFV